jgi:putative ABC transport system permease protein
MLVGYLIYLVIMTGAAAIILAQTGIVLDPFAWNPVMLWAPLALISLGALSGIVPAMKAYRTPVAENLTPAS